MRMNLGLLAFDFGRNLYINARHRELNVWAFPRINAPLGEIVWRLRLRVSPRKEERVHRSVFAIETYPAWRGEPSVKAEYERTMKPYALQGNPLGLRRLAKVLLTFGFWRIPPLLAYAVTEEDEGTGAIYFARTELAARMEGAEEHADGDPEMVVCRRAPWADWCAPSGIVHASMMIENGWHFECHGCGATIDSDWLYERNLTEADVIGTQHGAVFCRAHCKSRHEKIEERKKQVRAEFLDAMRQRVRTRFGDVVFRHDDFRPNVRVEFDEGVYTVCEANLPFDFPGMEIAPAIAHYHLPHKDSHFRRGIGPSQITATCCAGDRAAFEAFAEETRDAG